jgi:hypothetical protein
MNDENKDNGVMTKSEIREALLQAVQAREVTQKMRVGYDLRIQAVERGDDEASPALLRQWVKWHDRFAQDERHASEDVEELAADLYIIEVMCGVHGVGVMTASKLVSQIDIERANSVSALWRYCGYGVGDDGQRDRPVKGERLKYNKRAKAYAHLIGVALIRKNSPYRPIYEKAREKYDTEEDYKDWTKAHKHMAALRKVKKLFLAHLWEVWRDLEGLPISEPYVLEHGGHVHKHEPRDFGWLV